MAKLKHEKRPAGQREDYMFLANEETGTRFKALHEMRTGEKGEPVLVMSIAPVDEDGHALRNDADQPDVKWHTHPFTEWELSDPGADPEARMISLLAHLIDQKDAELKNRGLAKTLGAKWGSPTLDLSKRVGAGAGQGQPVAKGTAK